MTQIRADLPCQHVSSARVLIVRKETTPIMDTNDEHTPPLNTHAMETMLDRLLKQWLYRAMEQRELSVDDLAARLELDRSEVDASLRSNDPISAARLHLLAGAVGISSAECMDSLPSLRTLRGDLAAPGC